MPEKIDLAIVGAGALGTSSAQSYSKNSKIKNITLYDISKKVVDQINNLHENKTYFPGIKLSKKIKAAELNYEEVAGADLIIFAIPSHALRENLENLKKHYSKTPIITTNKGMEIKPPYGFSHEIVKGVLGKVPHLYLYTRAFAKSIISGEIVKNALASDDLNLARWVKDKLENDKYNVRITDDFIGLETAGVMKNITAIAVGLAERLGFLMTSRVNIIDEGIREWRMLSERLGGKKHVDEIPLGDFWMSACEDSRNYRFGLYFSEDAFSKSKIFNILMKLRGRKYKPLLEEANKIYEEIFVEGLSGVVHDILISPIIIQKRLVKLFSKSPYIETLEGNYSIPPLIQRAKSLNLELPLVDGIYKTYFVDEMKSEESARETIKNILQKSVQKLS